MPSFGKVVLGAAAAYVVWLAVADHPGAAPAGAVSSGQVPAAYTSDINAAGQTCPQITPALLAAQLNQESGFDPHAVSSTDAEGIAQFEPGTAASLGVDPWSPSEAIAGMARLDCSYVRRYGSVTLALAAYNGGPGVVDHWRDVSQTREYVTAIQAAASRYHTTPAPAPSANNGGGLLGDLEHFLSSK